MVILLNINNGALKMNFNHNVKNLIVITGGDLSIALQEVNSEVSKFDFSKVLPCPKLFTKNDGVAFYHSLMGYLSDLELTKKEVSEIMAPHYAFFSIENFDSLVSEYRKTLKLRYDQEGNLREPNVYKLYPATSAEYIELGKQAYNLLITHKAFTDVVWMQKNWCSGAQPENVEVVNNTITFNSLWTVPFPVIEKWANKHKLSFEYLTLTSGSCQWSYANYIDGNVINKRWSEDVDLNYIMNAFNTDQETAFTF